MCFSFPLSICLTACNGCTVSGIGSRFYADEYDFNLDGTYGYGCNVILYKSRAGGSVPVRAVLRGKFPSYRNKEHGQRGGDIQVIEGKALDVAAFSERKGQGSYPCVELPEINVTLPLVLGYLEPGDIQIVAEYKGKRRMVGTMSSSAYNIIKLLKTQGKVVYCKSESEVTVIESIVDYLEVV